MEVTSVPKALPQALEDELRWLRGKLTDLDREHREAAKPYWDRLLRIESLRDHTHFLSLSPGEELPPALAEFMKKEATHSVGTCRDSSPDVPQAVTSTVQTSRIGP